MIATPQLDFIVPDLQGAPTGGTLYNRDLIAALRDAGIAVRCRALAMALAEPDRHGLPWVDTLYLDALPQLHRHGPVGLLVHYLPSLVTTPTATSTAALSAAEQFALHHGHAFVVPSDFMAGALVRFGVAAGKIAVVEPGLPEAHAIATTHGACDALMIANLSPGKGILPFLELLASRIEPGDRFALTIIGSDADPSYAEACRATWDRHASLRAHVDFAGPQTPEECLRRLQHADVVVSASRMESYGLVLGHARACGIPIVAHAGGNAAALVDRKAGGQLVADDNALAMALLALVRDPSLLARRREAARAHRLHRSWASAAATFASAARRLAPP